MMWNTRYGMGQRAGSMMGSYGRGMMRGNSNGHGAMLGTGSPNSTSTGADGAGMMGGSGTRSGMMGGGDGATGTKADTAPSTTTVPSATTQVSLAEAHTLAQQWLDQNEPGVKVETGGDAFPGHYTLETLKAMLPGIDGIEACRQIRAFSDAYIVVRR